MSVLIDLIALFNDVLHRLQAPQTCWLATVEPATVLMLLSR